MSTSKTGLDPRGRTGFDRAGICEWAKEAGAEALYVSATPSESAVGFYQSQGFHLAEQVHPDLYALEPEDIHMIRELN